MRRSASDARRLPDGARCRPSASEIALIEAFADTRVIGITINHEHMSDDEITAAINGYRDDLDLPATDPLTRPLDQLVDMVLTAFPTLAPTQ